MLALVVNPTRKTSSFNLLFFCYGSFGHNAVCTVLAPQTCCRGQSEIRHHIRDFVVAKQEDYDLLVCNPMFPAGTMYLSPANRQGLALALRA